MSSTRDLVSLRRTLSTARKQFDQGASLTELRVVDALFRRHPKNTRLPQVLLKVATLDAFYMTNLRFHSTEKSGVFRVAEEIHRGARRLDGYLLGASDPCFKGEDMLEWILQGGHHRGVAPNLYSFASKYAHFSNPARYPIWDSRSDRSLRRAKRILRIPGPLSDLEGEDWYFHWAELVGKIGGRVGLRSYREIDKALYTWNGGAWG